MNGTEERFLFVILVMMLVYKCLDLGAASFKAQQAVARTKRLIGRGGEDQAEDQFVAELKQKGGEWCSILYNTLSAVLRWRGVILLGALFTVFALLGYGKILLPQTLWAYRNALIVATATATMSLVVSLFGMTIEVYRLLLEGI